MSQSPVAASCSPPVSPPPPSYPYTDVLEAVKPIALDFVRSNIMLKIAVAHAPSQVANHQQSQHLAASDKPLNLLEYLSPSAGSTVMDKSSVSSLVDIVYYCRPFSSASCRSPHQTPPGPSDDIVMDTSYLHDCRPATIANSSWKSTTPPL